MKIPAPKEEIPFVEVHPFSGAKPKAKPKANKPKAKGKAPAPRGVLAPKTWAKPPGWEKWSWTRECAVDRGTFGLGLKCLGTCLGVETLNPPKDTKA